MFRYCRLFVQVQALFLCGYCAIVWRMMTRIVDRTYNNNYHAGYALIALEFNGQYCLEPIKYCTQVSLKSCSRYQIAAWSEPSHRPSKQPSFYRFRTTEFWKRSNWLISKIKHFNWLKTRGLEIGWYLVCPKINDDPLWHFWNALIILYKYKWWSSMTFLKYAYDPSLLTSHWLISLIN